MLVNTPFVKLPTVVAKVCSQSVAKLSPSAVSAMARWALEQGNSEYIDELVAFHNNHVNPCDLAVSPAWFECVCVNINKRFPLVRLNLAIGQYDPNHVEQKLRPQPDTAKFYSNVEVVALGKNADILNLGEETMKENRRIVEPILANKVVRAQALKHLRSFETNVVRLMLAKPLVNVVYDPCVSGKADGPRAQKGERAVYL